MSLKVVIIGGVAAGPKTAAKIVRQNPEAQVTVLEKGKFLSFAGCGLPYYVSGVVKEQKALMSTPIGVVRDAAFFQKVKNVKVLTETEALEIDRAGKRVRARRNGEADDSLARIRQAGARHRRQADHPPHPRREPGEHHHAAQRA